MRWLAAADAAFTCPRKGAHGVKPLAAVMQRAHYNDLPSLNRINAHHRVVASKMNLRLQPRPM